jgi:hypothetical protein
MFEAMSRMGRIAHSLGWCATNELERDERSVILEALVPNKEDPEDSILWVLCAVVVGIIGS